MLVDEPEVWAARPAAAANRPRVRQRARRYAVAAPLASGPPALARPGPWTSAAASPDPLAHAPLFRRAAGQQTLAEPAGLAVDAAGHSGWPTPATTGWWSSPPPGGLAVTFGKNLDQPTGIATDAAGHVWVADTGHDRVVEFSSAGRVLAIFGSAGRGGGQLNHPVALAVTPAGDVWVADQGHGRVVEFPAGGGYRISFAVPTPAASRWTPAATSGCPAPVMPRPARSVSTPRPGISSSRSASPRRATVT